MLCILYLYLTGRISDFDMSDRTERRRGFIGFVLIYFVAAVILTLVHAPVQLIAITWGYWGAAVVTMIITRWWKISTHAFGIAGPFAAMFLLFNGSRCRTPSSCRSSAGRASIFAAIRLRKS